MNGILMILTFGGVYRLESFRMNILSIDISRSLSGLVFWSTYGWRRTWRTAVSMPNSGSLIEIVYLCTFHLSCYAWLVKAANLLWYFILFKCKCNKYCLLLINSCTCLIWKKNLKREIILSGHVYSILALPVCINKRWRVFYLFPISTNSSLVL